jgi:hypothetical protein
MSNVNHEHEWYFIKEEPILKITKREFPYHSGAEQVGVNMKFGCFLCGLIRLVKEREE